MPNYFSINQILLWFVTFRTAPLSLLSPSNKLDTPEANAFLRDLCPKTLYPNNFGLYGMKVFSFLTGLIHEGFLSVSALAILTHDHIMQMWFLGFWASQYKVMPQDQVSSLSWNLLDDHCQSSHGFAWGEKAEGSK
ncbi:hypothetical protein BS47DRAFT_1357664 [Hydnum rufescens UP504]|uniref:Uncharacterized protein n=1 Tax=Hydnum rufescens UP504 TaxID=1448309 RepID=A0A9P6B9V2_9AGAM|nr:hypothetical protein BS47DRAFT_1357664 [Hydnum rufescens UP504]